MANPKICSIPDCGKPARTRGFCNSHHKRLLRYGDPLSGRTPHGEPLRFVHDVILSYDGDECITWPFATAHGYGTVQVDGSTRPAHRYVCKLTNGTPPTPEHDAAHSCGNGHLACVTKRHIRWATRKENQADRLVHGTHNRGERQGQSKLTENDVQEIRCLKGALTQREIALRFGISNSLVALIQSRKRWAWLE